MICNLEARALSMRFGAIHAAIALLTRDWGLSAMVAEQHAPQLLAMTDVCAVLERGTVVCSGRSSTLTADVAKLEAYLGVAKGTSPEPGNTSLHRRSREG